MSLSTTSRIAQLALEVARTQLGQEEQPKGSNSGPMVSKYLLSVGLKPGYPWCQAFMYWCYATAAARMGIKCPVIRTAAVHDLWNRTPVFMKHTAKDMEAIQPGAQFILLFAGGTGHTGIVERVDGNIICTIEGNSNNNGSREGYAVVRHRRSLTDPALAGFITY